MRFMLQLFFKSRSVKERGGILLMTAFSFFVLFGLAGLGIDIAQLFWAKRQAQLVVDASAIAAAKLMITNPSLSLDDVRAASLDLMAENLRQLRYSEEQIQEIVISHESGQDSKVCFGDPATGENCTVDPTDESVIGHFAGLNIVIRKPTLILGAIPGFAKSALVSASSMVVNLKLQVVLVLDESSSMDTLMPPAPGCAACGAPCAPCNKRIGALKYAARSLVDILKPFDQVGIVSFSRTIQNEPSTVFPPSPGDHALVKAAFEDDAASIYPEGTFSPLPPLGDDTNRELIKQKISDNLSPLGSTNIAAGLRLAGRKMPASPPANTMQVVAVVSDGAPTDYYPITNLENYWPAEDRIMGCDGNPYLDFLGPFPTQQDQKLIKWRLRFMDTIMESKRLHDRNIAIWTIGVGDHDTNFDTPFQCAFLGPPLPPPSECQTYGEVKDILLARVANDHDLMRLPEPAMLHYDPLPAVPYVRDFPCVTSGAEMQSKPYGKYLVADSGDALLDALAKIAKVRSSRAQ